MDARFVQVPTPHQSLYENDTFRFLNSEAQLREDDWQAVHPDKLWRYNLHYFDDLNAEDADARTEWHRRLISRWIKQNPPAKGDGWEPYPVSLRLVNWIKWIERGHTPVPGMFDSLATQAGWLADNLEYHLLGNHLFANAKGLAFAAQALACSESKRWAALARSILDHELDEQVLRDGGHFELSPMYHSIILADVLDLAVLAEAEASPLRPLAPTLRNRAGKMLAWLEAMCHPDGEIAFFNDAAMGIAPRYACLARYAAAYDIAADSSASQPKHLRESGYVRAEKGPCVVLLDCARVGPDYLPGHAHADTLSFEASLFGHRLIVNGGTSCYGNGPRRSYERSTAAHSTVEVDGHDSSEVWASFRVARRARLGPVRIESGEQIAIEASHDGYRRLAGSPRHTRSWVLGADSLRIEDSVSARGGPPPAVARYHLHPDVGCEQVDTREFRLTLPNGRSCTFAVLRGEPTLAPSTYAPEFGIVRETKQVVVSLAEGTASATIRWVPSPIPPRPLPLANHSS